MKPLAIDLCCGVGGFTEAALAENYDCVGFDIERHVYGQHRYPAQLVVQDILTLHGSQFKDAAFIWASPPCQFFSYTAMPWSKAKALAAKVRADPVLLEKELALFKACFRIQREACEAAGRHVPMIVENVRGTIPWVGRSRWNFGSFHLWGDVPALMPMTIKAAKVPGFRFDGSGNSFQSASVEHTGQKVSGIPHIRDGEPHTKHLTNPAEHTGFKTQGMNWSDRSKTGQDFTRITGRQALEGVKLKDEDGYERSHPHPFGWKAARTSSKSPARKMASAMIAKIPEPLARHIARTFYPYRPSPPTDGELPAGGLTTGMTAVV